MLIGAMCLCAAIELAFKKFDINYLVQAAESDSSFFSMASTDQFNDLIKTPFAVLFAFISLAWTTIYAVKFSFLVFFKKLINRVTKMGTFYRIVEIITLLT